MLGAASVPGKRGGSQIFRMLPLGACRYISSRGMSPHISSRLPFNSEPELLKPDICYHGSSVMDSECTVLVLHCITLSISAFEATAIAVPQCRLVLLETKETTHMGELIKVRRCRYLDLPEACS